MNTYELIEAAATLIETTGWSQGANARAADGVTTSALSYPDNPRPPVSFCAHGALCKVSAGQHVLSYTNSPLEHAFQALSMASPNLGIVGFNDTPGRTKEEVLSLMRETAAKLRTAEAVADDKLHAALFD